MAQTSTTLLASKSHIANVTGTDISFTATGTEYKITSTSTTTIKRGSCVVAVFCCVLLMQLML